MPRMPIDYSKTVIYKIVCNDLNIKDLYIGSTTDFTRRKRQHKETCTNVNSEKYYLKKNEIIRQNGGWDNWSMLEIEKFPCVDANEARTRERYWYDTLNTTMNSNQPITTETEYKQRKPNYNKTYYDKNKEKIIDYKKQYDSINKDKIKKMKQEKFECECGLILCKGSKSNHKKSPIHLKYLESL
jgi:hypothetical protein